MVIRIRRGSSTSVPCQFVRDGRPVSLAGANIDFAAKWRFSDADADAVLTKEVSSGITVVDEPTGRFTLDFDPIETLDLEPGDYYYDVRVSEAGGTVTTVLDGALSVLQGSER